jgi:hypothetical protein
MNSKFKFNAILLLVFCIFLSIQSFAQQTEGTVKIESSTEINDVIAQKKEYNKSLGTIKGYKIQLFYGNEKDAYEVKDEFKAIFPEISTKIIFSSPEWKVQVGNYKTRIEADKALVEIKIDFPNAIIFATDIEF